MESKEGDKSNRRPLRDPSTSKNYKEFEYDSNSENSRFEKLNELEDSGDDRNYEPDLKRKRKNSSSDYSSDENVQLKTKSKVFGSTAGQDNSKTFVKSKQSKPTAGQGSSKNLTKSKASTSSSSSRQTTINFAKSSDTSVKDDTIKKSAIVKNPFFGKKQPIEDSEIFGNDAPSAN